MTRVGALPFADRLWIQWRTAAPVGMRSTCVRTRRVVLYWCRLDEPQSGLDSGYYLVRRSISDGWLYRVDPEHPSRRMEWHGREPELVGEVGVSDTPDEAEQELRAQRSALRELGLDEGTGPTS